MQNIYEDKLHEKLRVLPRLSSVTTHTVTWALQLSIYFTHMPGVGSSLSISLAIVLAMIFLLVILKLGVLVLPVLGLYGIILKKGHSWGHSFSIMMIPVSFYLFWSFSFMELIGTQGGGSEKEDSSLKVSNLSFRIEHIADRIAYNKPKLSCRIKILSGNQGGEHEGVTIKEGIGFLRLPNTQHSMPLDAYYLYLCQEAELLRVGPFTYVVKLKSPPEVIGKSSLGALVVWRYHAKKQVCAFLGEYISGFREREFLRGVITGEYEDPFLVMELKRIGLQHLLAVSGFHFSLLATFLLFLLRSFLPWRVAFLVIWVLLTGYGVFVGFAPSVLRAYVGSALSLLGMLLGWRSDSYTNLAGAALLQIVLDPLALFQIGFQFSYLATFAILLLQEPLDSLFSSLLPTLQLKHMLRQPWYSQLLYVAAIHIRRNCALAIGVFVLTTPLVLFHFGKLNLLSIGYNLFIPFITMIVLYGVIMVTALGIIFKGIWVYGFLMVQGVLRWLFDLVYWQPLSWDLYLVSNNLVDYGLYLLLTVPLVGALVLRARKDEEEIIQSPY
jgi:ComEC/Rec2-related protein